ncbi:putative WD-40 repeat protein [Neospora caninum Liverpool]|uniref:Putative WD-40 repeat protein n=1 Tax=Neospora caninum (strain Liverpool) TaxID=572307 RepID=F0VI88_NEOCL|nr:putative WD-40 repeat protein [Neospora caninum Liverpool]CBZ53449.1 putative WD-40 repeat protein [Neospora caninum Liverpool]CEL67436.1 TPA: WD-40 repeat protein, putative [Neospora caninum Liverpool]|eukprot:XP_003883481.1 putative WD-40 repeat protein [Neospora caninum Liverpool]
MVKAYLRYVHEEAFGLNSSPHANVSFFRPSAAGRSSFAYALTCTGASVTLWNTSRQCRLVSFSPPPSLSSTYHHAVRIALSASHSHLAVGYSDGSIRVWEAPTASDLATLAASPLPASGVSAAPHVFSPPPGLTLQGHRSAITALCWGPGDTQRVPYEKRGDGRTVSLSAAHAIAFEHLLISGSADGDIIVWDRIAGVGLHRLHAHAAPVTQVLALKRAAKADFRGEAGGRAGDGCENDASEETTRKRRRDTSEDVQRTDDAAGPSRHGQRGKRKLRRGGHESANPFASTESSLSMASFQAVEVSGTSRETGSLPGSGLLLVSAGKDGLVKIWDADLELCLQTLVDAATGASGAREAWSLAVNPQQTRLVVGCGDQLLRVYALHGLSAAEPRVSGRPGEAETKQGKVGDAGTDERGADAEAQINRHTHLRCIAGFLGFLRRPSGGQKKTTCLQFVTWTVRGGGKKERRRGDRGEDGEGEDVGGEEEEGVLVVGSGNSRSVEVFKVCGETERRKRMKRRQRRSEEKKKKREQKAREAGSGPHHLDDEEKEEEAAGRVTDEFVFLSRLHTASVIKTFHLRAGCAPQQVASDKLAGTKDRLAAGGRSGTSNTEVQVLLGLADNAFETWKVDVQQLSDRLSQKTPEESETNGAARNGDECFKQLCRVSAGGHRGTVRHLSVSHDSAYLLSIADEGFKVWTTHTRQCVKSVSLDLPLCGFFVAGNDHVVLGTKCGDLYLYDIGACTVRQHLGRAHTGAVNALAEHPKHTGFASISADKSVKLFVFHLTSETPSPSGKKSKKEQAAAAGSVVQFRQVGSLPLPDQGLDLRYSMDGKFLICALLDMTVLVFYSDTCKLFLSLYGHQLPVLSLAVSSDSTRLATGSADKTVKVWGLDFGNIQHSLLAHDDAVTQVLFLFGTHYLLSASSDASLKLWDVDRQSCLVTILPSVSNSPLRCLAASQDGDRVFVADASRLLQCWRRTGEQMFAEEEEERRWEENAEREALREDAILTSTATSAAVVTDRTSKRTMETVRTTERLMEVLDEAREQQEADEAYAAALLAWERRRKELVQKQASRRPSSKGEERYALSVQDREEKAIEGLPPRPVPPPGKVELMGKTAMEHVLRAVATWKAGNTFEVLVALPFDYAYRLLEFLVAHLSLLHVLTTPGKQRETEASSFSSLAFSQEQKKPRRMQEKEEHAEGQDTEEQRPADAILCLCPIESVARVALILVQLHFRLFLASPKQRQILARLQGCLRPLLVRERDRMRFNSAALTFLQRKMDQERFQALPEVKLPGSKRQTAVSY